MHNSCPSVPRERWVTTICFIGSKPFSDICCLTCVPDSKLFCIHTQQLSFILSPIHPCPFHLCSTAFSTTLGILRTSWAKNSFSWPYVNLVTVRWCFLWDHCSCPLLPTLLKVELRNTIQIWISNLSIKISKPVLSFKNWPINLGRRGTSELPVLIN
jgi:hypothetical protein